MDQILHRVLWFDRFALDLTRGCLRAGDLDIALRPKTFEVLRHLAENAGRLVPKQELQEAVWSGVIVTDDSLVQCIRELRDQLGDAQHRLIKTVSRRGYLLDVTVTPAAPQSLNDGLTVTPSEESRNSATRLGVVERVLHAVQARNSSIWAAAAAGLASIVLGAIYLPALFANSQQDQAHIVETASASVTLLPVSELFTETDAQRLAALADKKQLPLPSFQIRKFAHDAPEGARRFVGIWVSDTGWKNSNRQFMLIVTDVDRDGTAAGYMVNGPPQPGSFIQSPPHSSPFKARISGASLSYSDMTGAHVASLTAQNRIEFKLTFRGGGVGEVALDPVWTLVEAERTATAASPTFKD
jgi:DNA-binding winged helix-turn-helix (wHTH) protein